MVPITKEKSAMSVLLKRFNWWVFTVCFIICVTSESSCLVTTILKQEKWLKLDNLLKFKILRFHVAVDGLAFVSSSKLSIHINWNILGSVEIKTLLNELWNSKAENSQFLFDWSKTFSRMRRMKYQVVNLTGTLKSKASFSARTSMAIWPPSS